LSIHLSSSDIYTLSLHDALPIYLFESLCKRVLLESLPLASQVEGVNRDIGVPIDLSARPSHLDKIGLFQVRHSDVHSNIVTGKIALTAPHIKIAAYPLGAHGDPRADPAAVALHAFCSNCKPVISISTVVAK